MTIELEATESGSPIPLDAGTYPATVVSVEEAEGKPEFGGAQVKFFIEPAGAVDDDGRPLVLWAWASKKLTTKSKLWRWVTAITGSPPKVGKVFRIEDLLVGKPCRVQVGEEKLADGSTRKKVTDLFGPSKRPAPTEEAETGCAECFARLEADGYSTAAGVAYCGQHGPRAAAQE